MRIGGDIVTFFITQHLFEQRIDYHADIWYYLFCCTRRLSVQMSSQIAFIFEATVAI